MNYTPRQKKGPQMGALLLLLIGGLALLGLVSLLGGFALFLLAWLGHQAVGLFRHHPPHNLPGK